MDAQIGNFVKQHALSVSRFCNVHVLHVISNDQEKEIDFTHEQVSDSFTETIVFTKKIRGTKPHHNFFKFRRNLKGYEKGFQHIEQIHGTPDVVHLNVVFPGGIFVRQLFKKRKIPYIITEHWTGYLDINPEKMGRIQSYFTRKIGGSASCICPVSHDLEKAMKNYMDAPRYEVVNNVANADLFSYRSRDNGPIKLLHVSTLIDEHKNVSGIIRATKALESKIDFKLSIIGNGDFEAHRKYAESIGCDMSRYHFDGEKTTPEVATLMHEHDVFILFSNFENSPCVIGEAHCTGMLVVGTDVGGVSEMLSENNGILIQARDEQALSLSIESISRNLPDYNRKEISSEAHLRYGQKAIGQKFKEIYQSCID